MQVPENIFLVGLMGAGKSTVGRRLAAHFDKTFQDCDQELEARTGVDIPYIFEVEGEEGFRRREAELLRELAAQRGIVLATGGGVVLAPENRELLRSNGFVVWLRAPLDVLHARTSRRRDRPLLVTEDPRQRLADLMEARDPLYREVAHVAVDNERDGTRRVLAAMKKALPQ